EIITGEDLEGLTSDLTIDLEIVVGEDRCRIGLSLEVVDLERRSSLEGKNVDLERISSSEWETVDLKSILSLIAIDLERISSSESIDLEGKMPRRRVREAATDELERVEKGRAEANGGDDDEHKGEGEHKLEREEEE
ncbi:hypothetical protein ACLOJK_003032, partial [Asimina triloba]